MKCIARNQKNNNMKRQTLIAAICGAVVMSTFAFKTIAYDAKPTTAEVEQIQGLAIFVDAKPVREYDFLGAEKIGLNLFGSGKYSDVRDRLIKKVRKEYPNANGIILHLADGKDAADAVRIK